MIIRQYKSEHIERGYSPVWHLIKIRSSDKSKHEGLNFMCQFKTFLTDARVRPLTPLFNLTIEHAIRKIPLDTKGTLLLKSTQVAYDINFLSRSLFEAKETC